MVGIVIALILWRPRGKDEAWTEMTAEEKYMLAKKYLLETHPCLKIKTLTESKMN
jgi:hypothetical protein